MLSYSARSNNRKSYTDSSPTPSQRCTSSAIAGGLSGGVVSYTLGRKFSLQSTLRNLDTADDEPGKLPIRNFVVIGTLSYLGQKTYDALDNWQLKRQEQQQQEMNLPLAERRKPMMQRLLDSKWLLMKPLSDEEYLSILNEKKSGIEIEIALLDEKITEIEKAREVQDKTTSG